MLIIHQNPCCKAHAYTVSLETIKGMGTYFNQMLWGGGPLMLKRKGNNSVGLLTDFVTQS